MKKTDIPLPNVVFQNQPAAHRRAVYLCADEKFIPYSLFLAQQIAAAHPARDFDICIVSANPITPHPLFAGLGIRIVQIDTGALEQQVQISDRIGFATYLRIFMPRLWQADYDRLCIWTAISFINEAISLRFCRNLWADCLLPPYPIATFGNGQIITQKTLLQWVPPLPAILRRAFC